MRIVTCRLLLPIVEHQCVSFTSWLEKLDDWKSKHGHKRKEPEPKLPELDVGHNPTRPDPTRPVDEPDPCPTLQNQALQSVQQYNTVFVYSGFTERYVSVVNGKFGSLAASVLFSLYQCTFTR